MVVMFLFGNILLTSCGGGDKKTDDKDTTKTEEVVKGPKPGEIPYDFPTVGTTSKAGEFVLAPSFAFLEAARKDASATFIFYSSTMTEPGSIESKLQEVGSEVTLPNSLIIPIPANQSVKKGDIVLTWWQSGSGMQRAIVTDATDPLQPKVKYLDLDETYDEAQLKPNSFVLLSKEWEPGTTVVFKSDYYQEKWQVIRIDGSKVLAIGWAGKMAVLDKAKCNAVPVKFTCKKGDKVQIPYIGSYKEAVVKKVDDKLGRVWVEFDFAGSMTEECISQGDITTGLVL